MNQSDTLKVIAAANGVDDSTAAALMAIAIKGCAGPRNTIIEHAGFSHVPTMAAALVDDSGAGAAMMERLLYPARDLQTRIENRFRYLDCQIFRDVLIGAEGSMPYKIAFEDIQRAVYGSGQLGDVQHDLNMDPYGRMIDADLGDDELADRLDLVLRPSFLLESPSLRTLGKDISNLHMASGLLWGGNDFSVDPLTKQDIGRFLGETSSARVKMPPLLCGGQKDQTQPVHMSWLLKASSECLNRPEVRTLLHNALLVDANHIGFPCAIPSGGDVERANRNWFKTVGVVLLNRRRGEPMEHAITDEPGRIEFEERLRDYRYGCAEAGVVSTAVIDLPRLLLCLPIMGGRGKRTNLGVEACFHHAEILSHRHQRLWHKARVQEEVSSDLQLAKRLLARIRERQPLSQRDLIRSFDKQVKGLYLPTLELMLKAGLITERPAKVYSVGATSDVEAALRPLVENHHLKVVA